MKIAALAAVAVITAMSAQAEVIYTGELGKKVIGYNGPTPVTITITGGKISKIEAAANHESPQYFHRAEAKVFPQFVGKTVKEALATHADAATGATYSSKALIENIRLGLKQASKAKSAKKKSSTKSKRRSYSSRKRR